MAYAENTNFETFVPRNLRFHTLGGLHTTKKCCKVRGVFQKYAERFHRMFAIAARLMIFHAKHAWYIFIK